MLGAVVEALDSVGAGEYLCSHSGISGLKPDYVSAFPFLFDTKYRLRLFGVQYLGQISLAFAICVSLCFLFAMLHALNGYKSEVNMCTNYTYELWILT